MAATIRPAPRTATSLSPMVSGSAPTRPGLCPVAQSRPRGTALGRLRRGEAGDRHPIGGAGHVIEPRLLAEMDRSRIAAMLAADAEFDAVACPLAALRRDLDQFAHTLLINGDEGV